MAEVGLKEDLERARRQVEDAVEAQPWLRSIGIGLTRGRPGVVVSVEAGWFKEARECLRGIEAACPIEVREMGPVKSRESDHPES